MTTRSTDPAGTLRSSRASPRIVTSTVYAWLFSSQRLIEVTPTFLAETCTSVADRAVTPTSSGLLTTIRGIREPSVRIWLVLTVISSWSLLAVIFWTIPLPAMIPLPCASAAGVSRRAQGTTSESKPTSVR